MPYFWICLGAYLLGSVPSGFLLAKSRGIDLREVGSGNIGATNALRVLGKKLGYLCFAMDFGKGLIGMLVAKFLAVEWFRCDVDIAAVLAAVCLVLGHNFPVWLKFRGGKGIATSAGIGLGLFPPIVFAAAFVAWMGFFFTTRYVSVASIASALALGGTGVVLSIFYGLSPLIGGVGAAMTAMALWRHRSNVVRLLNGTEPRFEKRVKT